MLLLPACLTAGLHPCKLSSLFSLFHLHIHLVPANHLLLKIAFITSISTSVSIVRPGRRAFPINSKRRAAKRKPVSYCQVT